MAFADEVDHVKAETVDATVKPEPHRLMHFVANRRVFPIQIWLFLAIEVEIVLSCTFIPFPRISYVLR
jgi:hypothetical protein